METKSVNKILYLALRRSFWYGMTFSIGFHMLVQDWLGLEEYIIFVREHWVNVHWIVGLLLATGGLFLHTALMGRFHWLREKEKEDGV